MHWMRRAASRADCTAGSNNAINTEMIAMTTSSSMSVKPEFKAPLPRSTFASFFAPIPEVLTQANGRRSRIIARPTQPNTAKSYQAAEPGTMSIP